MKLTLDTARKYQTYMGVGASGAWWAQAVGNWTKTDPATGEETRRAVAQLLWSETRGIGLNIYRHNLGSGSAASGKGFYWDPLRRATAACRRRISRRAAFWTAPRITGA